MESNLRYVPLDLRIGNNRIGHLDFEEVTTQNILEQMLVNAVWNMEGHCIGKRGRQASAFAERIESGFQHAQQVFGSDYSGTSLPRLYGTFKELRGKYLNLIQ